jgi:hypothetical protein
VLEVHPEPPDGETSAEKARRLWMPRAFLQTTFTSRVAQGACSDYTETAWTHYEHRRLLDEEAMAVCRVYAEPKQRQPAVGHKQPEPMGNQGGRSQW